MFAPRPVFLPAAVAQWLLGRRADAGPTLSETSATTPANAGPAECSTGPHVGELHDASVVYVPAEEAAAHALGMRKQGVVQQARALGSLLCRGSTCGEAQGSACRADAVSGERGPPQALPQSLACLPAAAPGLQAISPRARAPLTRQQRGGGRGGCQQRLHLVHTQVQHVSGAKGNAPEGSCSRGGAEAGASHVRGTWHCQRSSADDMCMLSLRAQRPGTHLAL